MDDKKSILLEFVDALHRREWSALRRLLLCLSVPGISALFAYGRFLGEYQGYAWAAVGLLFLVLLLSEIFARPRSSGEIVTSSYPSTVRGLVSFGEDDATAFATLGRGMDVAKVINALQDPQFRFGVLFAESGCGKTSLLRAGVVPELKKRGYEVHVDDINNQEEPLDSVARFLRSGTEAVSTAGTSSSNFETEYPWLAEYDLAPRQAFLILDQFEQFFLHYGRKEQEEPLLSFLEQWWTLHPASQLRILISIRDDYLGRLSVIQERLAYVATIHNHLRLRKFTPDDAVEVLRSMAAESNLAFHESAVRQACREELGAREDGTVSPVDLQILATGVLDLPSETRGFTAGALRSLGGLEGALERYLLAQLANVPTEGKTALAVLRVLSELKQGILTGWFSAGEIIKRLGETHDSERAKKMLNWLSNSGVRLIVESESPEAKRYRLVHDRLVPAVMKVSSQVLIETERASLLLDQRVSEYLSNGRRYRYLLPWNEWRLIVGQQALMDWGGREAEKQELLVRSGRRVKTVAACGLALTMLFSLGLGAWEFLPRILLWRTEQDLVDDVKRVSGCQTISEIQQIFFEAGRVTKDSRFFDRALDIKPGVPCFNGFHPLDEAVDALTMLGGDTKDSRFFDRALVVAQKMDNHTEKAAALSQVAEALIDAGDRAKAFPLFDQAVALADDNRNDGLIQIAVALARAGGEAKDSRFFDQAVAMAQKTTDYDNSGEKADALSQIAVALFKAGAKEKASTLLDQAEAAVQNIDLKSDTTKAAALSHIAEALATAGDNEKASIFFKQAVAVTPKMYDQRFARIVLGRIAVVLAEAGKETNDSGFFDQAVALAQGIEEVGEKEDALSHIAEALAKAGGEAKDSRFFDQAVAVAQEINDSSIKAPLLNQIAAAVAAAGDKSKASALLDQAAAAAQKIKYNTATKFALLSKIAAAVAAAGDKSKASALFDQTVALAQVDKNKGVALSVIAMTLATAGGKAEASAVFKEMLAVAQTPDNPLTVEFCFAHAFLGNLRAARRLAHSLPIADEPRGLALILMGWDVGHAP